MLIKAGPNRMRELLPFLSTIYGTSITPTGRQRSHARVHTPRRSMSSWPICCPAQLRNYCDFSGHGGGTAHVNSAPVGKVVQSMHCSFSGSFSGNRGFSESGRLDVLSQRHLMQQHPDGGLKI